MAAAMFGIGAVSQATTNVNPQNNVRYDKRNQNKESQPIQSQKQVSQKVTKEKSKGYSMRPFFKSRDSTKDLWDVFRETWNPQKNECLIQ